MPGLPPLPNLMPGLGKAAFPPEAPGRAAAPELSPKAASAPPARAPTAASATTALAAIREGIANEDRAAVRAGVEAVLKAGIVLEPQVQQMLKQWLPGGGSQTTSSERAPKEPSHPVTQSATKSALTANLLATIRAGIAKEDRAGVKAAVEAAKEKGVVLESHIQQMLDRWLPVPTDSDPPVEPSTAPQPVQTPVLPQQSPPATASTVEAKPATTSSAASQPILTLIRVGIANEDRAAVRSAVAAAAAGGIVLEPHVQEMLKKWLGTDQPDAGQFAPEAVSTPVVASTPFTGLPLWGAPLGVAGLVSGMPQMLPPAGVLPQIPGQLPGSLAFGSTFPAAIGSTAAPALLMPLATASGLPNTDPTQVASSDGAPVEATQPVLSPAAPIKRKIPPLPRAAPGAGVSIFKKPVLKKNEDLDKAMDDFFSEIALPDEPAPGVEEPPQAPGVEEPPQPAEDDTQPAPSEAPEEELPTPAVDPVPIATPEAASAPDGIQSVANDGSFMARFLAGIEDSVPKQVASAAAENEDSAPPKAEKESAPKAKRSLKEIQEARKAARKREASPPPPARENTLQPPPPVERPLQPGLRPPAPLETAAPKPPAKDEPMLWPGELTTQEEDDKKAKKAPEAWEYMKPDEFGAGNFFSFDSF